VYASEGLEAAFEFIQTRFMPLHEKQEASRTVKVKRLRA